MADSDPAPRREPSDGKGLRPDDDVPEVDRLEADTSETHAPEINLPREPAADSPVRPDWDRGFSLAQLFWLLVVVSVLLAVLRCFSPQIAAGLAGLAVLVGLVGMSMGDPPAIVRVTWWTVLAIYLAAAGVAVVRG